MAASKKNGQNQSQEGQEQKSSGTEPPNTGWSAEVPNKEGGSEEGYLFKPPYAWTSKEFKMKYHASCYCKKVEFEFHGDPIDAKHCHCTQCQKLHGAPFQWAALYHKTSVRLKHSCDPMYLNFYSTQEMKSDHSVPCKISCKNCGSPVFDEGRNMIMAYPSSFEFKDNHVPSAFAPSCHIFYGNRSMNIDDDVPKWKGHKEKSEQMDHAPADDERTMGKGKRHKAEDTAKSEQSPRRPTNLPTGASSLSDRIAALQRKSSINTNSSRRSASATSSGNNTLDDSLNNGSTISAPRSSSSGSQAVKDRIARFQVNEKPLLPKSSFGAPTPMGTGRQGNALRPYPGANASGSGSGQWGENILRPQMTGGVWSGGGEGGKSWTENATLRPQMTGTPWMGSGGRSLSPSPNDSNRILGHSPSDNLSRSPIRHRDAFLELEDEKKGGNSLTPPRSTPMRRGSSFSEAQMAAASAGLASNSRRSSAEDEKNGKIVANSDFQPGLNKSALPTLPDTPSKTNGLMRGPSSALPLDTSENEDSETLNLPTPPTSIPQIEDPVPLRDVRTNGDVEIIVGGASPAKIAQLRRSLSGNTEDAPISISSSRAAGEIPSAPAPFLQELLASRGDNKAASSSSIDKEEADFAQMKVSSLTVKEGLIDKIQSDISSDTNAERNEAQEKVTESSLAQSNEADQEQTSLANSIPSINTASTSHDSNLKVTSARQSSDMTSTQSRNVTSGDQVAEGNQWNGSRSNSNATLTSSTTSATLIPPSEEKVVLTPNVNATSEADRKASQAVDLARKKSQSQQRIRKPPLGRPMTAAEMDASDDEYEPGWASVLSATSSRT